jgi:hypothetical protein
MLMSVFCVACDSPNNTEQSSTRSSEGEVQPVSVSGEVAIFFESYLPSNSGSRSECFFVDDNENRCLMINSAEELQAITHCSVELPAIDFDNFTLIIGQHEVSSISYYLLSQSLDVESEKIVQSLRIKITESGWTAMGMMYYWDLYPKLPKIPIVVDVIYEK